MFIMLTVADLLLPRLVTVPFERAEVPVQKEIDRLEAELEEIRSNPMTLIIVKK